MGPLSSNGTFLSLEVVQGTRDAQSKGIQFFGGARRMKSRRRYTRDFKLRAVYLLESRERPAREIAEELGVRRNQLYKWREQLLGNQELTRLTVSSDARRDPTIRRLQRELGEVRLERDIYKKVASLLIRETTESD